MFAEQEPPTSCSSGLSGSSSCKSLLLLVHRSIRTRSPTHHARRFRDPPYHCHCAGRSSQPARCPRSALHLRHVQQRRRMSSVQRIRKSKACTMGVSSGLEHILQAMDTPRSGVTDVRCSGAGWTAWVWNPGHCEVTKCREAGWTLDPQRKACIADNNPNVNACPTGMVACDEGCT